MIRHRIVTLADAEQEEVVRTLDDLAEQGWEVVSVSRAVDRPRYDRWVVTARREEDPAMSTKPTTLRGRRRERSRPIDVVDR